LALHARKPTTTTMTMDIHRPTPEERAAQYKPGSIKRVKLNNFLTYDAVEFFPGSRLVLFLVW
jgi:hypothetical protein